MRTDKNSVCLFFVALASVAIAAPELSAPDASQTNRANTNATEEAEMKRATGPTEDQASKTPPGLTKAEEAVLRAGFVSVDKSREIGQICLKHRLQKQQVTALLGERCLKDAEKITYAFAPSQRLDIHFDTTGNVVRVELTGQILRVDESTKPNK